MNLADLPDFRELNQSSLAVQVMEVPPMQRINRIETIPQKLKVASYCRVSTEEEIQLGSLENQIIHYTNYIRSKSEWHFAGIYSDKGKSGTGTAHRAGFNKMMRSARSGEIDLIICKSLSRFSRNIADTLSTIQELDKIGVKVIFEKENLETGNASQTFLINVLSAFAEEESRNISENINWAFTKRFEMGEIVKRNLLGYKFVGGDKWEIVEQEAEIVKEAYRLFLGGESLMGIAKGFINKGYQKKNGRLDWTGLAVRALLTNEWYLGDVLSRKTFVTNNLTHRMKINEGEHPQYYIDDHHEGIVSSEDYEKAQVILARNKRGKKRGKKQTYPFSSRLVCENCGSNYHRYSQPNRTIKWRCGRKMKSSQLCDAKTVVENILETLLIKAFEDTIFTSPRPNVPAVINKLMREIKSADAVKEHEQNMLRLKLERILIEENNAILKNLDIKKLKKKRLAVEKEQARLKPIWDAFDEDEHYRRAAYKQLERLTDIKANRMKFKEICDLEFIRAWVIRIKVESPYLFTVMWINGKTTKMQWEEGLMK